MALVLAAGCAPAPHDHANAAQHGAGDDHGISADPDKPVSAVDVDYAAMMMPHHQQALELSAMVPGRSANPEVGKLAFLIDRDQVSELGQLQGFLNLQGAGGPQGMGGMAGMTGMADAPTLERLRASSGPDFDRLWLTTMIAHHEGALVMARDHLRATGGTGPLGTGSASPLAEFSRVLLLKQQQEIDRMRGLLG